jgi:hypothetical protein
MNERTIGSGRQEALGNVTMLLDLAISRSRGNSLLDGRTKELDHGCREAAKQKLGSSGSRMALRQGGVYVRTMTF